MWGWAHPPIFFFSLLSLFPLSPLVTNFSKGSTWFSAVCVCAGGGLGCVWDSGRDCRRKELDKSQMAK
jgi:hypothetical protein